jgi:hypothetical protein
MIKDFFNKLFGYRWSIYIATDQRDVHYIIHSDSVSKLLYMVSDFFIEKGDPKSPWNLHLVFNKKQQENEILINKYFFDKGYLKIKDTLFNRIRDIDPEFENYVGIGKEIVFIDVKNNKQLKLNPIDYQNPQSVIDFMSNKPQEKTAVEILYDIFY